MTVKIIGFIFILILIIIVIGLIVLYNGKLNKQEDIVENMKITSPNFENNSKIPVRFTSDGENINPNLEFEEIPENTKSLVLIVDDPDAPVGTWVHWIVFNINPKIKRINKDSVPDGVVQGKNTWGKNNYGGPNPPSGTHRYFFKLFALDKELDLNEDSNIKDVERAIENHILDKAELIGLYR